MHILRIYCLRRTGFLLSKVKHTHTDTYRDVVVGVKDLLYLYVIYKMKCAGICRYLKSYRFNLRLLCIYEEYRNMYSQI